MMVECQRKKRTTKGKGDSRGGMSGRGKGTEKKKWTKEGKRGASGEPENPVAVFRDRPKACRRSTRVER